MYHLIFLLSGDNILNEKFVPLNFIAALFVSVFLVIWSFLHRCNIRISFSCRYSYVIRNINSGLCGKAIWISRKLRERSLSFCSHWMFLVVRFLGNSFLWSQQETWVLLVTSFNVSTLSLYSLRHFYHIPFLFVLPSQPSYGREKPTCPAKVVCLVLLLSGWAIEVLGRLYKILRKYVRREYQPRLVFVFVLHLERTWSFYNGFKSNHRCRFGVKFYESNWPFRALIGFWISLSLSVSPSPQSWRTNQSGQTLVCG